MNHLPHTKILTCLLYGALIACSPSRQTSYEQETDNEPAQKERSGIIYEEYADDFIKIDLFVELPDSGLPTDSLVKIEINKRRDELVDEIESYDSLDILYPDIRSSFYATLKRNYHDGKTNSYHINFYEYVRGYANGRSIDVTLVYDAQTMKKLEFDEYFMVDEDHSEMNYSENLAMQYNEVELDIDSINEVMYYPIADSIVFVLPPSQVGFTGKTPFLLMLHKENPLLKINPKYN